VEQCGPLGNGGHRRQEPAVAKKTWTHTVVPSRHVTHITSPQHPSHPAISVTTTPDIAAKSCVKPPVSQHLLHKTGVHTSSQSALASQNRGSYLQSVSTCFTKQGVRSRALGNTQQRVSLQGGCALCGCVFDCVFGSVFGCLFSCLFSRLCTYCLAACFLLVWLLDCGLWWCCALPTCGLFRTQQKIERADQQMDWASEPTQRKGIGGSEANGVPRSERENRAPALAHVGGTGFVPKSPATACSAAAAATAATTTPPATEERPKQRGGAGPCNGGAWVVWVVGG
jgi:hypothetical protein